MCIINPRVDFAFKKLFGSEENKDLLISLINAIVTEVDQVVDLELRNPYNVADYLADKMSILDIKACDAKGRWFNVEMQIGQDLDFDKRAMYYWSKLVTDQLSEGMMFRELKKTISINILDFNVVPNREEFHNRYRIMNVATGQDDQLHDVFELHYVELRKFKKSYDEVVTALDRWSTFLTRAHEIKREHIPQQLQQDQIIKAISSVDRMFDEDERSIYGVRMQALADVASKIASAKEEGMQKGMHKGMQKGMRKGREEGRDSAVASMVQKAFQSGLNHEVIAEMFDLPLDQVKAYLSS
ncbi:MAG: Rpn family recombination-promoting nuclease/putative transposase [Mariprofundaceae bacterium]|nr:Rpn family recombination-promoting nuclease/putative transposase [Mariprofundaceae bacterium]